MGKISREDLSCESSQNIDNGLPTDRIIGRGCRRSLRTTTDVARVEELICSHVVALSSVLRFQYKISIMSLFALCSLCMPKSFNFIDAFNCYKQNVS